MHHTHMYQDHVSYSQNRLVRSSVRPLVTKFQPHHTHMQHSQVSRITDVCILLLESPCSFVRWSVRDKICRIIYTCTTHTCMLQDQGPGSQICASYTHASGSRIEDHRYVHHTHIDQSQGSRIIDMCIIHTCSIVKDRGTQIDASYMHVSGSRIEDHRYVHHTHMHQSQGSRNIDI